MPAIIDNPIINSYIQGLQMRRQQESEKFKQEQQVKESARQDQQLKGYLEHLKAEEAHSKGMLDLQSQQTAMTALKHRLEAMQYKQGLISGGLYDPNTTPVDQTQVGGQIQQTQSTGTPLPATDIYNLPTTQQNVQPTLQTTPGVAQPELDLGGGITLRPEGIRNQQQLFEQQLAQFQQKAPIEAQAKAQVIGAETKAKEAVLQPGRVALQTQKDEAAKKLQEERAASALAVANANGTSRLAAANIAAASRIAAAKVNKALDPAEVANNALLHAVGQGGTPFGNNDDDRAGKAALSLSNYVDFDPKDARLLRETKSLNPMYDKMEQIISQLPESKIGATGQRIIAAIPGSDLKNLKDELISASGQIAKSRGGESRALTDKDIGRQINALGAPGKTREQALSNLRFLRAYASNRITEQLLGGMTDKQKILIFNKYEFDPNIAGGYIKKANGEYTQKYATNPENPDEWGVFNTKTQQYEKVK